jgi:hypothetical protein
LVSLEELIAAVVAEYHGCMECTAQLIAYLRVEKGF